MMGEGAPIQRWVQLAGYTLIIGTALTVLSPFLVPLAWAAILAFATWRVYERVRRRLGERSALAAALMTALVVLLLVIPAGLLSLALAAEAGRTFADFRLSALTLPAWVPATLRELPWFGPRLADQLVRALADPSALERWILANAGGWAAAVATAAGNVGRNALDAVLGLLLAWGVLVISLVDNVIRSWFLRGAVRVPFLLGFFGVLGGIAAFGAVGIFLGPIAIALLLALWREWAAAT